MSALGGPCGYAGPHLHLKSTPALAWARLDARSAPRDSRRGLTLGHLIGVLQEFFQRLGMKKLRFKPAFNPYTEPSMEIFSYSEELGKASDARERQRGARWVPAPAAHREPRGRAYMLPRWPDAAVRASSTVGKSRRIKL